MLLFSLGFMVYYLLLLCTQFGLEKKKLVSESQVTYGYMDDFTFILNICFYKCQKEKILIIKWKSRFSVLHVAFQCTQSDSAPKLQKSNLPNIPRMQLCSQMLFCRMIKTQLRKNSVNYLGKLDHMSVYFISYRILAFVISFYSIPRSLDSTLHLQYFTDFLFLIWVKLNQDLDSNLARYWVYLGSE